MHIFYILVVALFLVSCNDSDKTKPLYVYKGIEWQVLSFEDTFKKFQKNNWLWLDAEFLTENDSVFWNSHHEGADKFFIELADTVHHPFFFPFYLASEQDSLMIITPKHILLKDVFNITQCPPFLEKNKTLRCFVKIKKYFLSLNDAQFQFFQKDESRAIEDFLIKHKPLFQKDTNNLIWLEPLPIPAYKERKEVREATVAYSGYFLDGRMIDHSDSLGIRYNDTLQLVEGLNFVIKKLEVGQSAKIILPSRLAFGKRGSFNKTIPPYTPLLYEIKLIQIQ